MNSTGLVFGEALRAALGSPYSCPAPPSPPHPTPTLLHIGLRLGDKRDPQPSPPPVRGEDVITRGLAPLDGEAIVVENCIDFGQRQGLPFHRAERPCGVITLSSLQDSEHSPEWQQIMA